MCGTVLLETEAGLVNQSANKPGGHIPKSPAERSAENTASQPNMHSVTTQNSPEKEERAFCAKCCSVTTQGSMSSPIRLRQGHSNPLRYRMTECMLGGKQG
ncbi:hypothetical protein Q8A73_011740 [Channa argus]|nr:hypothetical protein Q8A73_011740 [Channa argus]